MCQLMEQLRPKTGIYWKFCFGFSVFLLKLCLPDVSKYIKSNYIYIYIFVGGIPTLNIWMVFMKCPSSSWSIYTKYVSNFTEENRAIFELYCKVQICHETMRLLMFSLSGHILL